MMSAHKEPAAGLQSGTGHIPPSSFDLKDDLMMEYTLSMTTTTASVGYIEPSKDPHMMQYTMSISLTDPSHAHDISAEALFDKLSQIKTEQHPALQHPAPQNRSSAAIPKALQHHQVHRHQHSHSPLHSHGSHSHSPSHSRSHSHSHSHSHSRSQGHGQHGIDTVSCSSTGAITTLSIETTNPISRPRTPQEVLLQDLLERIDHSQQEKEVELEVEAALARRHHRLKLNPELLKDHHTMRQNHGNANIRHSD